ncbi:MAG: dephospho-CoA kinase [Candidatus Cloacimonetes bacterium]|nr:dephospho-CoA kinase [Candidatus Cloacimonadota bacterium]
MEQVNRPLLIAITGGIASGKSLVSHWFEERGFAVVYADIIGHNILEKSQVINSLYEKFGSEIIAEGKISRKKLGEFVFADAEKLRFLNNLMHPLIRAEMKAIAENSSEKYLFYEIPLLFENGLADKFDLIINVFTDKETKIARMKVRDGIDKKSAEQRIAAQMPDYLKKERADINIENNSEVENVFRQLEAMEIYLPKFKKKEISTLAD